VRIPRDASAQWAAGTPASRPRRGDLLFFGDPVHHVAMYAGRGRMVHAPGTGQSVEVISTATPSYAAEYVGARRLLP
jgi:cell wall-associated NlpC family hydrolase